MHPPLYRFIFVLLAMLALAQPLRAQEESPIDGRFMLLNHFGEIVTDRDFGDHYLLVYFGYTFCPDICPTSLNIISQTMQLLGKDAERIQPLFITVDPERDTPEVLRNYVGYFHPRLIGLTGSPELVARAAANYRVRYEKVVIPGLPADQYQMDHSAGVFLLDPNGRFLVKFAHGFPPPQMTKRIQDFVK